MNLCNKTVYGRKFARSYNLIIILLYLIIKINIYSTGLASIKYTFVNSYNDINL